MDNPGQGVLLTGENQGNNNNNSGGETLRDENTRAVLSDVLKARRYFEENCNLINDNIDNLIASKKSIDLSYHFNGVRDEVIRLINSPTFKLLAKTSYTVPQDDLGEYVDKLVKREVSSQQEAEAILKDIKSTLSTQSNEVTKLNIDN
jgi:hypothetical protein